MVAAMLRVLQIGCVVALVLVLWTVGQGYLALSSIFTADFHIGFVVGALVILGIWWLNEKLDASSRSGDTTTKK
jgi:uncharacterized membrane protein YciS (DUF1049 family)